MQVCGQAHKASLNYTTSSLLVYDAIRPGVAASTFSLHDGNLWIKQPPAGAPTLRK